MDYLRVWIDIVERVAEREGVPPEELDERLHDVVDTDGIERLLRGRSNRPHPSPLSIEFTYCGYAITVTGAGEVAIEEEAPTTPRTAIQAPKLTDVRSELEAERDHREIAMDAAASIMSNQNRPFREKLDRILKLVRTTLDVEYATLSHVDDSTYVFEAVDVPADAPIDEGQTAPLDEVPNCRAVIGTSGALVLEDIEEQAPQLADPYWDIASYLGVPVFVDGELYGTFCFYGEEPKADQFSDWELSFVELLSSWVSAELEQRERRRSIQAQTVEQPSTAN